MNDSVTVSAAANIALIKYWGKKDGSGNQPATGSLSIGLEDLRTRTRISRTGAGQDTFATNLDDGAVSRMRSFLDDVRRTRNTKTHFHIETDNDFPTGAGLASSASRFAALALGLNALLELNLSDADISRLARRGSGSAARSIHGGYVEVVPGDDAAAQPVMPAEAWPLDVLVAITDNAPKPVGSTDAMNRTAGTSPWFPAWVASHEADMQTAKRAILEQDFMRLAEVSEHNCLKMHGAIMAARPPIIYWRPATVALIHKVMRLRDEGAPVFFTVDAGAQVKVICEPAVTEQALAEVQSAAGVSRVIRTCVGGAPRVTRA